MSFEDQIRHGTEKYAYRYKGLPRHQKPSSKLWWSDFTLNYWYSIVGQRIHVAAITVKSYNSHRSLCAHTYTLNEAAHE